jgi:DNA polymerase-3 subunit gamma/tau
LGSTLKQGAGAAAVAEVERSTPSAPPAPADIAAGNPFRGGAQFPAPASLAGQPLTEGALAKAPETAAPSVEAVRHAIGSALVDAGHNSAAQLLGSGAWTVDGASLRIEVPIVGKKMLALTVNAAAEKIIRQELQRIGAPARFLVVPAESAAQAAGQAASTAAPPAGSVQEAALANPLVHRAQEIFKAEVRSVLDLRPK